MNTSHEYAQEERERERGGKSSLPCFAMPSYISIRSLQWKPRSRYRAIRIKHRFSTKMHKPSLFEFSHANTFTLNHDSMKALLAMCKLRDLTEFAKSFPVSPSDHSNDEQYTRLETILRNALRCYIFFDSFEDPSLLFARHQNLEWDMFEDARLPFVGASVLDASIKGLDDGSYNVEICLKVECMLAVQACIDLESYLSGDLELDEEVEGQVMECQNMFNFSLADVKANDEFFEHEWRVKPVSASTAQDFNALLEKYNAAPSSASILSYSTFVQGSGSVSIGFKYMQQLGLHPGDSCIASLKDGHIEIFSDNGMHDGLRLTANSNGNLILEAKVTEWMSLAPGDEAWISIQEGNLLLSTDKSSRSDG